MNARAIAEILAPVFAEQNWTWFESDEPPGVDRLETEIESLVIALKCTPDLRNVATGRLMAYRIDHEFDPDWIHVGLDFVYDC